MSRRPAARVAAVALHGTAVLCVAAVLLATAARADTLEGVVRDSSGNPIGGADFDVFTLDGVKTPLDAKSHLGGHYRILFDRGGRYDIGCKPAIGSGLASLVKHGVLVSGVTVLDWTLPPSVRVIGHVRDFTGAPVSGADLNFDRLDDGTRQLARGDSTGPFGTFAAYIQAGDYRLTVNPRVGVDLAPARLQQLILPTADTLSFTLQPAVHLSGSVRDPVGSPVSGAKVSFERPVTGERVASWGHYTLPDGTYRAGLAGGSYLVLFHPAAGSRLAPQRLGPVELTTDQSLDVTLQAAALLSGRVRDRDGDPVVGARWDAFDEAGQHPVPTPDDNTDYDGRYTLALVPGFYRLKLIPPARPGLDTLVFENVAVARDSTLDVIYGGGATGSASRLRVLVNPTHRTADLRILLPAPGPLRIEVFDAAGRRVRTLSDGWIPAGPTDFHWDGRRKNGAAAHTGLYFARAVWTGGSAVTRFILLP